MRLINQELIAVNSKFKMFFTRRLNRKVKADDCINAGGVVLDSIKDLLGDNAPFWIKALLTSGKELVDIALGP